MSKSNQAQSPQLPGFVKAVTQDERTGDSSEHLYDGDERAKRKMPSSDIRWPHNAEYQHRHQKVMFANRLTKDKAAVAVTIASRWSNGQIEGLIGKFVKRQMYGRGKIDLLQARIIRFS